VNLDIVIIGLSITSSWGNGHATTYRALAKGLAARGNRVKFLERDVPWYRNNRDLADQSYCATKLYRSTKQLVKTFGAQIAAADLVILGSYVQDGTALATWITSHARGVTAFYDIDTPVTLKGLEQGTINYIAAAQIPHFDLYLSFTGGPILDLIETVHGSPRARPLYCGVDPETHRPLDVPRTWELGYLGTYSADRQAAVQRLLIEPALAMPDLSFVVAGPQYPRDITWPPNVQRIAHLAPDAHPGFYCGQRYTLNMSRAAMISVGHSPSVRLFEAAACGTPIITDRWAGIETFFSANTEILIADTTEHVVALLRELPEERRHEIAVAAQRRVLTSHTGESRAKTLEDYYHEVTRGRRVKPGVGAVA
jgi:spore maturation protein CgeB